MEIATENLESTEANNFNGCIGILDVYIHEARDLRNICIYHEQDVYATVYLTNDPKTRVSTEVINGGGKNPVFNQNLRLDVKMMMESSSLRCEIWMLSRIKNYLEDQLLGFAVMDVDIHDIVFNKKRDLSLEYELSSSDLLHVPAGSVKLTLSYEGIIMPEHEHPTIPSGKEDENSAVSRRSCHDDLESKVDEVGTVNGKRVMMMKDEEKAVVVQEEIMEMYMKSMMEATEAMVNIKLPSELGNDVDTDKRFHESKNKGTNPRVFYGSNAFF